MLLKRLHRGALLAIAPLFLCTLHCEGARAQGSRAEQIFGAIVDQLEQQARQSNRRESGPPQRGIWSNRWNPVPQGPSGTVRIVNESNQSVSVTFARPGGGIRSSSVGPRSEQSWSQVLGTDISVFAAGPPAQFSLSGGALNISVQPDGNVVATSSSLPPDVSPVLPGNVGAVYVTNRSPQLVELSGSAPPPMVGMWRDAVAPGGQWVRTDLPVGGEVNVTAGGVRSFPIEPGSLRIFVQSDGTISSNKDGFTPTPTPPPPSARRQTVRITNMSSANVNARFFPPFQSTGKLRVIVPREEIEERFVRGGTRIVFDGSIPTETITVTGGGLMQLTILPEGRVRFGGPDGVTPPPMPSDAGDVKVTNRSGTTITVSYGDLVREVVDRSAHSFERLPRGRTVRITGNGATATFTHDGSNVEVRVQPDGKFDNLPATAAVTPDSSDPLTTIGHVLVANQASSPATLEYTMPGAASQTATLKTGESVSWSPVAAGTQLKLQVGGQTRQTTVGGGQWTSLVVATNGTIAVKTTAAKHEPELTSLVVEPDTEGESNSNSSAGVIPPDSLVNPDPPSNDDPPVDPPTNTLPTPDAAPLTQSIVARFSRKTISESELLVDMLATASDARLRALESRLTAAGIDAASAKAMVDAARRGDASALNTARSSLTDAQRTGSTSELNALEAIAALREQLLPLRGKLQNSATTAEMLPHITAINRQGENANNSGITSAMQRMRRDLVIRDTLNRALETTGIEGRQVSLPQGEVHVISHPWITKGNIYFAPSGLLLLGASGEEVVVTKMEAADVLRIPVAKDGTPVPRYQGAKSTAKVLLANPAATRSTLRFQVNGTAYSLAAGEERAFDAGPQYVIEFSRGSSGATAKYNISKPAMYAFTATDQGWNLVKKKLTLRIANPEHSVPVGYQVDGRNETLQPGDTAVHQSSLPITIAFDTGESTRIETKRLTDSDDLYFAVDLSSGYWNLFDGTPPAPPKASGEVVRIERPALSDIRLAAGNSLFDFSATTTGSDDLLDSLRP